MRKNKLFGSIIALFSLVLLASCSNSSDPPEDKPNVYDFSEDKPFITAYSSPAGPDDFRNMYRKEVAIYQDGKLTLTTSATKQLKIGSDVPKLEIQLEEEKIKELQKIIEEEDFLQLPRNVTSPSEDGEFYGITVNLEDESKSVDGLNPDDEHFLAIHQAVFDALPNEAYKEWETEVEEHIWELNSLYSDAEMDYRARGPFLQFISDHGTTEAMAGITYKYQYDITLDAQLRVTVLDKNAEEISDIPVFQMPIDEAELEEIQIIVLKNFWKLNEYLPSGNSGNGEESITVYLTDDEKTVTGKDISHPRFLKIKESIIKQINPDTFSKWEERVKEQLVKIDNN